MRRALSILLLTLFSVSLAAPVLLALGASESNLPACCRRDGKHGCSINKQARPAEGAAVSRAAVRCALFPAAHGVPAPHAAESANRSSTIHRFDPGAGDPVPAFGVRVPLASRDAGYKRGPPVFIP